MHHISMPRRSLTLALGSWLALCALALTPPRAAAHETGAPCRAPTAPALEVNVNTASAAELERLPHIGPARARAIVQMRQRLDGFKRPSQLLRVKGIGRATLRELLPHIRLVDPDPPAQEGTERRDPVG